MKNGSTQQSIVSFGRVPSVFPWAALLVVAAGLTFGQVREPVPYAAIAMPQPDSGIDQRVRDSLLMRIGRVRVNQAGYRTMDVQASMGKFYYMGAATRFSVFDTATKMSVGTGNLSAKGFQSGTKIAVKGSTWAGKTAGGDTRYTLSSDKFGTSLSAAPVQEGVLPTGLLEGHTYRVLVGADTSVAFSVSDNLYGEVRDGVLKFFGVNRSGDGPSWFHAPSHLKDGTMAKPSAPGAYKGGWYDCGDHLKEPQTMGYAISTLAMLTATLPDRDADHYGSNHANTLRTDGIPDILAEARFGAQFFVDSWKRNGRSTGPAKAGDSGMVTGVGDFGKDHGWWGRPENQDAMSENGRGGWNERNVRMELGANVLGDVAGALAVLSIKWRPYDAKWADTALMAAKDMYAYAKKHLVVVSSPAYNGAGPDKVNANLALAATELLWATRDSKYLQDIAYDKTLGNHGATWNSTGTTVPMKSSWEGGWMVMSNPNLVKGGANTDWANRHSLALYTFYKLILSNKDSALRYGVRDEAERQNLITHTMAGVIQNLSSISGQKTDLQIPLPSLDPNDGGGYAIRTGSDWYVMHIQQEWVWNRYQMGNTTELFFYYDIAKDLEAGLAGAELTKPNWKRADVRQLMIRQLDYQLGVNPWDVSMIMGLGDKNFNHPHHRAANPEGRNTPGSAYGYHVPVGALYGGYNPLNTDSAYDYWNDYTHTEICLDGAAASLSAVVGLAMDVPLNIPPKATVKVVYVSDTLAQIQVELDKYGSAKLDLGLVPGTYTRTVKSDSVGVTFVYKVGGLKPGTQYFFDVVATDLQGNADTTDKWENPLPAGSPFSFTTKSVPQGKAQITNVKVCNVTADSAEIMWYTPNGEYQSDICYGTSPTAVNTCVSDADVAGHPTKFHYVKIGGLKEQTDYWFKVGSDGTWDDKRGEYYRFRTPVKMANFSVYAVQYDWAGMPALGINVVNNEARNYDSLSVRVYVRSKDTVGTHIVQDARGVLDTVPMAFVDAMAARYDICQAYNGAGFNLPCSDPQWGPVWSWGELNRGVQMLAPVKMPETTDSISGTSVYYFDLPLGPTMMQQGSRIRFDVMFAVRSEYEKTLNQPQLDLVNWVKAFVPSVPAYKVGDKGWFDVMDKPFTLHPMGKDSSNDWSFVRHSTAAGDPVDFIGVPRVANQTAANALIDNISVDMPLDPYLTVYRKGEFVYGFSPSSIEQATKKTSWGVNVVLAAPFNLPSGATVVMDQPSSVVHVKGSADVFDKLTPAAKGIVTDIWVNGARLSDAEMANAARWNSVTKLWDLDVPVKMGLGGNNVDVTIFGGGGQCSDTATSCISGCAFYDAEYFVQFSRGLITKSILTLLDVGNQVAPVKTAPDSLGFRIQIVDKDRNRSKLVTDTVLVTVTNPLRGFKVVLRLPELGIDSGTFRLPTLFMPTAKAGGVGAGEFPFLRGDTLWVSYQDADDTDDVAKTFVFSEATWPLPQRAMLLRDCGGTVGIRAYFDKSFTAVVPFQDATVTWLNPAGDSVGVSVIAAGQITKGGGLDLGLPISTASWGGWQTARLRLPVADGRGGWVLAIMAVTDSIGPWLDSSKVIENVQANTQDTALVWSSEKIRGLDPLAFVVARGGIRAGLVGVDSVRSMDGSGRAWMVLLRPGALKPGDSLGLAPRSTVRDLAGNAPADCPNLAKNVTLVARPAPFAQAWIEDGDGDGRADRVQLVFRKRLSASDVPDSLEIRFGLQSEKRTVPVSGASAMDSVLSISLPLPYGWGATRGSTADGSGLIAFWKAGQLGAATSLADSVKPVLLRAGLRYGRSSTTDTMELVFSEPVARGYGSGWLVSQASAGLGLSDPDSLATHWLLPVAVGSVAVGDSVRPLGSHRWVQSGTNLHVGVAHRWIVVTGGDRAPLYGWFIDADGDGAVDHMGMRFAQTPRTRPAVGFSWGGTGGVAVDSGAWVLGGDGLSANLPIGPLAHGVTSFGLQPLGTWNSLGAIRDFPLYDSVAPVLVSANLRYASAEGVPDTLRVRWSEALLLTGTNWILHKPQGLPTAVQGNATVDPDGLGATYLVQADSAGFGMGDQARLVPASMGAVTDRFGNASEMPGVWVPIRMGARPIRLDFAIKSYVEIPEGGTVVIGPALSVSVRARPQKGQQDTAWTRLDGAVQAPEAATVYLTMTINRVLPGSFHLFDNAGVFVASGDFSELVGLAKSGALEADGSGMFQVRLAWDGRDQKGKMAGSGVYYLRLVMKDGGEEGEPVRLLNRVIRFGIKRKL